MFAGGRRRSSNIRGIQLFHELKQQFPTVPDHVVNACIASHTHNATSSSRIRSILEEAAAALNHDPMGTSTQPIDNQQKQTDIGTNNKQVPSKSDQLQVPSNPDELQVASNPDELQVASNPDELQVASKPAELQNPKAIDMNASESDVNKNILKPGVTFSKKYDSVSVTTGESRIAETSPGNSAFFVKRPDHLDIKPTVPWKKNFDSPDRLNNIQPSEKCKDVHKLLNSDKPPRSPQNTKRAIGARNSPVASPEQKRVPEGETKRKETCSTPTQTTDTLNTPSASPSVNLSLNVNCSMDLVQSPGTRRTSMLQVTPQQPWLQEPVSPRSYTSVNLTLRPPSAEPQAPIDITSQNSSLTYSTSSFDSQKGLQSRLQITVGPGGSGSVASVRNRPRSSYLPEGSAGDLVPVSVRAGSLNDLAASSEPPVILKQQARIERLRIELRTEKTRLEVMQNEVAELEGSKKKAIEFKVDADVEEQLRKEIKHLQYQCKQLTLEDTAIDPINGEDFYHNIYTGQRGPLNIDLVQSNRTRHNNQNHRRINNNNSMTRSRFNRNTIESSLLAFHENNNPMNEWKCPMCTFLNHPDLDKCEQCEMPRILHGKSSTNCRYPDLSHPPTVPNQNHQLAPSHSLPNFLNNPMSHSNNHSNSSNSISRPIGFFLDNDRHLFSNRHQPPARPNN